MNHLQKTLIANTIFSSLSGILLIFLSKSIAQIFGVANTLVFEIIGGILLFFAVTIMIEIKAQRSILILWIIIQDLLWVLGSVLIVWLNPFSISGMGNALIILVALVVFFLALAQMNALSQLDTRAKTGLKQMVFTRTISTSKAKAWRIMADVGKYHQVAPNIDHSKILSGSGVGMQRQCFHGKNQWTETCTSWQSEEQYSFEVNTKAPDYPYPLKYLKGTWQVKALDQEKTKIIMCFDFQYKYQIYALLIHPFLKKKFSKVAEELLDNWQKMMVQDAKSLEKM